MMNLQHDTGRWSTEYTWSADDGMWGARVLHNFGRLAGEEDVREGGLVNGEKRVDEEDAMEGGLRGRFSAGAEVYVSLKEKSAGGMFGSFFTTYTSLHNVRTDHSVYWPTVHNAPRHQTFVQSCEWIGTH